MNRSRWLILAWTLAHFRARGQDTRRQRQLAAAIGARAACEAPALMRAAFTRETGLRQRPVMVT
jgi:hexokinase